jgi:hypothetical protein
LKLSQLASKLIPCQGAKAPAGVGKGAPARGRMEGPVVGVKGAAAGVVKGAKAGAPTLEIPSPGH